MINKNQKLILGCLLVAGVIIAGLIFWPKESSKTPKASTDVVFVGPEKYVNKFEESVGSARAFSNLFNEALKNRAANDNDLAIKNLNDSLVYVGIGTEKSMVYRELVEIYRAQGNLEKELYYLEEIPKYTMSDRIKKECSDRAAEIRQQLATQPTK